jgi:hypothetical protein
MTTKMVMMLMKELRREEEIDQGDKTKRDSGQWVLVPCHTGLLSTNAPSFRAEAGHEPNSTGTGHRKLPT